MISSAVAGSAESKARARVSAATASTASGSRPMSRKTTSMRVRTRKRGTGIGLRTPSGKKRGSSSRHSRSTRKNTSAVTMVPETNRMPKICRSARPATKLSLSSGRSTPKTSDASIQAANESSAKKPGTSNARRRNSSPSVPAGGVPLNLSTARAQPPLDAKPTATIAAEANTKNSRSSRSTRPTPSCAAGSRSWK